ncbi:CMP deaminase, partial [Candidatus Dojkabacteria bacterium]|nr:CMP deaminase [Candidatus Dojkabacteria bacterium]
ELKTKSDVLHSEENLILFAAKLGISLNKSTLYISHSPCLNCSRLIYGAGIVRVVYKNLYRDNSGIEFLKNQNILVDNI